MANSFVIKNYSILTSINETIYIKVVDSISYSQYEKELTYCEIKRNDTPLCDLYKIMLMCFSSKDRDYSVSITLNSDNLSFHFSGLVGGFLLIEFSFCINEKILSNDEKLTFNFNRIENKLETTTQRLSTRCESLELQLFQQKRDFESQIQELLHLVSHLEIFVSPSAHWSDKAQTHFVSKLSSKQINLSDNNGGGVVYRNIATFYQLQTLVINPFSSLPDLTSFNNQSVIEMELNCCGNGTLVSLDGLSNFPKLQTMTLINSPHLTNVVTTLKSLESLSGSSASIDSFNRTHQIKGLVFKSCPKVNVVETQNYCQKMGISLDFS